MSLQASILGLRSLRALTRTAKFQQLKEVFAELSQRWPDDLREQEELSFEIRLPNGETSCVSPCWLAVYQEKDGGPAEGWWSLAPLVEGPPPPDPPIFNRDTADGLSFTQNVDCAHGPWRNFRLGRTYGVDEVANNAQWPNQLFHGERMTHNVRHSLDIVRFVADAQEDWLVQHISNMQARKRDGDGWMTEAWMMNRVRSEWGREACAKYRISLERIRQIPPPEH